MFVYLTKKCFKILLLTFIPAFTKASAIAAPIPALAPVTMAVLPTNLSKQFTIFTTKSKSAVPSKHHRTTTVSELN